MRLHTGIPTGRAYSAPQLDLRRTTSKGREGQGTGREEKKEGVGRTKRKEKVMPVLLFPHFQP